MKRKRRQRDPTCPDKRQKLDHGGSCHPTSSLLRRYYSEVVTLRQYLASHLPKKRRRKLQQYGRDGCADADDTVVNLLDTTIVGTFKHVSVEDSSFSEDDVTVFTQQLSDSDASISLTEGTFKQAEVGHSYFQHRHNVH